MKTYSIGQFAKEMGVTVQTLRNWDKSGKLKPNHVSPSGHRYYSEDQLTSIGSEKSSSSDNIEIFLKMLTVFKDELGMPYDKMIEDFIDDIKQIRRDEV